MALFLLDNNIADDLGDELARLPLKHGICFVRDVGLGEAPTDSEILQFAALHQLILLTHDAGFDALDEVWAHWMHGPPHAGIVHIQPYGPDDAAVARRIDMALQAGWQPEGALWFLDLKLGWRRMRARRVWSAYDPNSPAGLF